MTGQPHQEDNMDLVADHDSTPDSESQLFESKNWCRKSLKEKFSERNLEDLFAKYKFRMHTGYFSVFLIIQTCLCVAHVSFLIFYAVQNGSWSRTVTDVVAYVIVEILFCCLVQAIFKQELVKNHTWIPHFASALAIASIIIVDLALPMYHTALFHSRSTLRPAYSTHALLACHMFFPQGNSLPPVALGVTTALLHLANLCLVVYRNSNDIFKQALADAVFFLCIILLGVYYRHLNDIFMRHTFLDVRACVESTLKLNYEKEREEQLMLSILPRHLASRVRRDLWKGNSSTSGKNLVVNTELYIERHKDVSILYADVVNYTKMTSSLPVNRLVEILNELFGRFDEASERHNVLRIKFLGDCYYCVSGVPQPNPDHAKSCVNLALEMVVIIKDVREANNLDIDMRIGIHSGSILCGILGKCKWQYDIWSRDVIIANRMEQTGKSGMVHITKQTLMGLGPEYSVEPGFGHLRDELLAKYNIETFFVIPKSENRYSYSTGVKQTETIICASEQSPEIHRLWSAQSPGRASTGYDNNINQKFKKQHGIDVMYSLKRVISGSGHVLLSKRAYSMNSNLIMYQQQLKMADVNMEMVIEQLPIAKYNQWFRQDQINPVCLTFNKSKKWEVPFLKQPDPLFKDCISIAIVVFVCIVLIQDLAFLRWSSLSIAIYILSTGTLVSLIPLTWTHAIWNEINAADYKDEVSQPQNKLLWPFYQASLKVIFSAPTRTILYVAVCLTLAVSLLIKLIDTKTEVSNSFSGNGSSDSDLPFTMDSDMLTGPWQMTEGCCLAIFVCFVFFRIHFQLKLIVALVISATYVYLIGDFKQTFDRGGTWNPEMPAMISHILSIAFLVFELHLVDRQTEYMSRLDYCWKMQIVEEKNIVENTRSVNRILLENILPIHVAEIYLNADRSPNELYHEDYDCVSVMFASLTNYSLYTESDVDMESTERNSLDILNLIICNFDDALLLKEFRRIEKIKVAGLSYMAACGLSPGTRDSLEVSCQNDTAVIIVIAKFAVEIMRILKKINEEHSTNFGLRVGISHGPVTAGVVGSQKPYYDIWGDAVNVASRMDSTGEAGKIQVPDNTAKLLEENGIHCERRGNIFVKGKGNMETFYIQLSDDCFLQEIN